MSLDPIVRANIQQAQASDPAVSVFVSASAGSGKTKLLIDRLLRLMLPRPQPDGTVLPGSDPARIQCLTFTKAAAAEMANRLQGELGSWVTLDDVGLDARLLAMAVQPGPAARAAARALFARVLDLPGGMRISTIHAFCQSLLRRFPLEAAISPHFRLAEDTDSRLALNEATETVLAARPFDDPSLALLAGQIRVGDFTRLVSSLQSRLRTTTDPTLLRGRPLRDALRRIAGVTHLDVPACLRAAVTGADEPRLRAMLQLAVQHGTRSALGHASARLDWLAQGAEARLNSWPAWSAMFLKADGQPRATGGLTSARWLSERPEISEALLAEAERLVAVDDSCRSIRLVELSAALLELGLPILEQHAGRKRAVGLLDYDDLIARTLALLSDPGVAWVLYKLDGGIDHLLLDEVQDTSPLQWQIAWALTAEFFTGNPASGPGRPPRTIFAVGDYKQSIYAFQGADPAQFHGWRQRFATRVREGGGTWREPSLTVSFRSVEPVLQLVDAVFASPEASRGLLEPGRDVLEPHVASRIAAPGRVELWPLTPITAAAEQPGAWQAPVLNAGQDSAPQRLAETLARWIAGEIGAADPQGRGQGDAPLRAGDVLVLVPRRSAFARALIRALKSQDVPVATLVRTGLADQIAVQDLLALCEALLLPQDDLTVACVLTSPLGGLSDDALMQLAITREDASLWDSLRARHLQRPDWTRAWQFLSALFSRVDFASPYALLAEALGALGGRARLLARLGPEAAEPVDELLAASLRFEGSHPPSLQGFVHWLRNSEEFIRREPDSAGDAVRVMTVHGAKGLQARLVVLPDTTSVPVLKDRLFWTTDPQTGVALPLWVPRVALASKPTLALQERLQTALIEEQNRLLYVALTRACDRLLVCGWTPSVPPAAAVRESAWYTLCRQGFERAGAVVSPFALGWGGERLLLSNGAGGPDGAAMRVPDAVSAPEPGDPTRPAWLGRAPDWRALAPPAEPRLPNPLAPSRPDGVEYGPLPATRSPLLQAGRDIASGRAAALARGRLVHSLLQHLPALPPEARAGAAAAYAGRRGFGMTGPAAARLVGEVLAVLDDPALAALFGPDGRAEQPLAGVADGVVVSGQVDRMLVLPDRVQLCDFKTGQAPPGGPERVPVAYLRQMAAYRALLATLYVGRALECLLVWTEGPVVMYLPGSLLDLHRPGGGAGLRPVQGDALPA